MKKVIIALMAAFLIIFTLSQATYNKALPAYLGNSNSNSIDSIAKDESTYINSNAVSYTFDDMDYSYLEKSNTENHEAGVIESIIEYDDSSVIGTHYPLFGKEAIDKITKSFIENYIYEFKKQVSLYKLDDRKNRAELNIDYETWLINDNIVSIKYTILINMPNYAHPDVLIKTAVYDLKTQQLIELDKILTGDYLKKISELVLINLKLDENYRDYFNYDELQSGISPSPQNYSNFVLKKEGIVFIFQKYQILPGSAGQPSIEIPYKDLDGFILADKINLSHSIPAPSQPDKVPEEQITKTTREIVPDKPMVALTFDDGPNPKSTTSILDTLKDHDAIATFFVLGNRVSRNKSIIQRIIKEGNEIGNHSYSHKQLTTLSLNKLEEEIDKTQNAIKAVTGSYPKIIRPTYGSINNTIRKNCPLPIILWSIDPMDWKNRNSEIISKRVLNKVKDGDIVLMHDIYNSTAEAVKIIIPELKSRGYQFVTVSELYEARDTSLEAGTVFRHAHK